MLNGFITTIVVAGYWTGLFEFLLVLLLLMMINGQLYWWRVPGRSLRMIMMVTSTNGSDLCTIVVVTKGKEGSNFEIKHVIRQESFFYMLKSLNYRIDYR